MNVGQVFAALTRMDLEEKIEAKRLDKKLVTRLGGTFDKASETAIVKPQDAATRAIGYLQMMGVVKRLYERYEYQSALWFYRKMKEIFNESEMSEAYKL